MTEENYKYRKTDRLSRNITWKQENIINYTNILAHQKKKETTLPKLICTLDHIYYA